MKLRYLTIIPLLLSMNAQACWNGTGTCVRSYDWTDDRDNSIPITASRMDTEDDGFATGITNSLNINGENEMSADFVPDVDGTLDLGTTSKEWQDLWIDGTANLDSVDIDSGAIDGATIGGTTAAAGTFTTLTATSGTATVGVNDTTAGNLFLQGGATGAGNGGLIRWYLSADHDTTYEYFDMRANQDDFWFGHSADGNAGFIWSPSTGALDFQANDISTTGALSKGSGSFKIPHPLPDKSETHYLVHSFIEGPTADNIYRGTVDLVNGAAQVNIDSVSGMTEGTFAALNGNTQSFVSNESGFSNLRSSVSGNILTVESQDQNSTDSVSWMVIGERIDPTIKASSLTDDNGKIIVEPEREVE